MAKRKKTPEGRAKAIQAKLEAFEQDPGPMPRHCDEYIDDPNAPEVLRKFLGRAREPAHGRTNPAPYPVLYATHEGKPVRVTVASRLGDVGIRYNNLNEEYGYETRVFVEELTDFRETP